MYWIICLLFKDIILRINWLAVRTSRSIIIRSTRIAHLSSLGIRRNIFSKFSKSVAVKSTKIKLLSMDKNCSNLLSNVLIPNSHKFLSKVNTIFKPPTREKPSSKQILSHTVLVSRIWMKIRSFSKIYGWKRTKF